MGYDRNPQDDFSQDGYRRQDNGRDYGSGRSDAPSSARDRPYAGRDRGDRYGQDQGQHQTRSEYGARDHGPGYYGSNDRGASQSRDYRDAGRASQGSYGREAQDRDHDDRGFIARAGDEVRSWFGDEDAERRREDDARRDAREHNRYDNPRDGDYHGWRKNQIAALDRDYDEYREENRTKFENDFGTWRTNRQTQRASLTQVAEHMDVVGSDGGHVGTVDKVRDDRIVLTRTDADAGGRHHSIPSAWVRSVDGKVTLSKSADEAKRQWRDEEQGKALFGDDAAGGTTRSDDTGGMLGRSFSGTY